MLSLKKTMSSQTHVTPAVNRQPGFHQGGLVEHTFVTRT
jgi:hypothetical protein